MLLAVLTISLAVSTLVMISSVLNAVPVDDKLIPLDSNEEKHRKKKGAAKSMIFGNHSKSIA